MDFYTLNFAGLLLINSGLAYREYYQSRDGYQQVERSDRSDKSEEGSESIPELVDEKSIDHFKKIFFLVYGLVFGADWLQGPFIYTLYKDQKGLPEQVVAALFTTGFLAGAVSALFVGSLADRYGRRAACLGYCIIVAMSLFSVLSDNVQILFVGRMLGGIGTTLQYTIFEAWMVTEYNQRNLKSSGLEIKTMFGRMITVSGVSAVAAGVFGEYLVEFTRTKTAPFMASACCLAAAFVLVLKEWTENYGDSAGSAGSLSSAMGNMKQILQVDRKVGTLALTSCCFEGSMYLFIYFWSPTLIAAHKLSGHESMLPFGMIFSSFMVAMMLGSMLFTSITTVYNWMTAAQLLRLTVTVASICLLAASYFKGEWLAFWFFCLYETCVGVYYPSMAHEKGKVIDDGVRANIYGMLRVPLNIYVVVALGFTREGEGYRQLIFVFCSGLLLLVSLTLRHFMRE